MDIKRAIVPIFVCLLLITQATFVSPAFASTVVPHIRKWTIQDGLPDHKIFQIYLDQTGLAWLSTPVGLSRFDGNEFVLLSGHAGHLQGNSVLRTAQGPRGYLWVVSISGSQKYLDLIDPYTMEGADFKTIYPDIPFKTEDVEEIYPVPDHSVLVVLRDKGLFRFDGKGLFLIQEMSPQNEFTGPLTQVKGQLWIESSTDLRGVDYFGKPVTSLNWKASRSEWVSEVFADAKDWPGFVSHALLWEMNHPTADRVDWKSLFGIGARHSYGPGLALENPLDGRMWVMDDGRLSVLSPDGGLIFQKEELLPLTSHFRPYVACFTGKGGIFVSFADGLYHIQLTPSPFLTAFDSLPGGLPFSLYGISGIGPGKVMVIGNHGLWEWSSAGTPRERPLPESFTAKTRHDKCRGTLVFKDQDSTFWLSCNDYLTHWDGQEVLADYEMVETGIHSILRLSPKPEGPLWLGTKKGIIQLNPEEGTFKNIELPLAPDEPVAPYVFSLQKEEGHESEGNRIWACTQAGLFLLDDQGKAIGRFFDGKRENSSLPAQSISHQYIDPQGIHWLSTMGNGLIRWDRKERTVQHFTQASGLSNNTLYAVLGDSRGNLWLPSNFGLMQFDPRSGTVRNYLPEDGLCCQEFNRFAHFEDENGTFYVGGIGGLSAFHPDSLNSIEEAPSPPFMVTDLLLQSHDGPLESRLLEWLSSKEITMPRDCKMAKIKVACLDFRGSHNYGIKIDGFSPDWQYQKDPVFRLAGIPEGSYVVHLQVSGLEGYATPAEITIPLTVEGPLKASILFWIIVNASLLVLIGVLIGWRNRRNLREKEILEATVASRTATIKAQSEELEEMGKAKSRFFTQAAHELKTPLTLILGPLEHLMNQPPDAPPEKAQLELMQRGGKTLLSRVNELLELQKYEAGKLVLDEQPCALGQLNREIARTYSLYASQRQIKFEVKNEIAEGLLAILDAPKLETILTNLLSNAVKFTPVGGRIVFSSEIEEEMACFSVLDTGPGIEPEDRERIFERFFQPQNQSPAGKGGTGVGLALAMELSKLMKGKLSVKSSPGSGSTFTLSVPITVDENPTRQIPGVSPPTPTESATVRLEEAPHGAPTVLIAEDQPDLRTFVSSLLAPHYHLRLAPDGRQAWEMLQGEDPIDLLVTDLMMPEMDGFQLIEKMKAHPRLQGMPVLVLSALSDQESKLRALRLGIDDYLHKPFSPEELLVVTANLLHNAEEREAWREREAKADAAGGVLSPGEQKWVEELSATIERNLRNMDVGLLADAMTLSERQLRRRIKESTGLSPKDLITEIRLQKARQLLEQGIYSTGSEVANAVGFGNQQYFYRIFTKRFGKSPKDYL